MKTFKVDVGNDPELLIKVGNRVLPSEAILSKKHRLIKVDNAAIELQPGPRQCLQEQNKEISFALEAIQKVLKGSPLKTARISLRPVEQLRVADIQKYTSVQMFGCQPSLVYDGRNLDISIPDVDPMQVRYRSVGYHVHLGSRLPKTLKLDHVGPSSILMQIANILHTTEGRVRLVQMCDLLVGLPAVLLERDPRVTIRRKTLGYGKAGEFREQPHGFEYRTLGSWPLYHPMWGWWANAAVRDALHLVVYNQDEEVKHGINMSEVAEAINSNNLDQALVLWHKVKKNLKAIVIAWEKATHEKGLNTSHPILSRQLLARFEFLAMKKDLHHRIFSFNKWCRRMTRRPWTEAKPTAFFTGFPNGSEEACARHADWNDFVNEWSFDKDLISKHLT
jgi:hypothetical protein